MEALSLIDVSAEDDLLDLASPPPPPRPDPPHAGALVGAEASDLEPAGCPPAAAGGAVDPDGMMEEQAPQRTESPKQRKAKTGVNLRKSLAWDSAFFTSEGVLDTEELAIVNSTFRKTQGSRLPGIMEEMRGSGESSTSTLESESWAMESLEAKLFDNVGASIQRSLGKPDKVPGGPATSSKPPKVTANAPRVAARKGVDRMPQTKMRAPVLTSQGVVGGKQRPQVTSKEPTAARVTLPGAAESKPSSKPPRALPRVATMRPSTNTAITSGISGKRSSIGGIVNRQAVGNSANTPANVRPSVATKSSSISKSGAFHGVSMDTKPDAKTKSATLGNKNRTAQRVPVRSSSISDITKTNSSRSSGNKIPARGHGDRASPSISPSSSIDSMSSVISGASTASTVGKMSHTSDSLSTLSTSLSPSLRKSNDGPPTTKQESSGTAASGDNSKATADTTSQGKGFKPSGLRRPTPKIGYFDAEKFIDQNIGAQVQLQPMKIQCSLPATPKSQPSSTQISYAASSTFGQQESKSTAAPHEKSSASKSKAANEVHLKVAEMEVEPFKVAEPEACTRQTGPVVSEAEAEKSIAQNIGAQVQLQPMKIQCSLPATPNTQPSSTWTMNSASSTFVQQESKPTAALHEETSASKSKAAKAVPLKVAQMELEPLNVVEHEACTHQTEPMVATNTAKENIPALHQNIQANVDATSLAVDLLSQKLSSIFIGETTPGLAS